MGEINHFIHKEHPLKLIENWKAVFGEKVDDGKEVDDVYCDGCQEPISVSPGSGSAYGCIMCRCFLHKKCAELRPTINHHLHPLHPLTLTRRDWWSCSVCDDPTIYVGLYYSCFECDFVVCTKCDVSSAPKNGEIHHFSHKKHYLMRLTENDVEKKHMVDCGGCRELVSLGGGSAYGCIQCGYFLHKTCAELTPTINHHIHPFHPLTLSVRHSSWSCDVCRKNHLVRGFSYWCSQCDFYACINCGVEVAPKEEALIKLEHEGHHPHEHTLTLHSRSATFLCDACHFVKKDFPYTCDRCNFWIHKTCASLAKTINLPRHHHHPLLLIYSLPENFYNFKYYCAFCGAHILKNVWLYHCANCRYFSHIECILNQELHSRDGPVAEKKKEEEGKDLLHFPISEAFTDPLKLLHSDHQNIAHGPSQDDDETTTEIHGHWSHDHPLILINYVESPQGHNYENMNSNSAGSTDLIEVCRVCVRPLSLPYYSCSQDGCFFSLHKYCSQLPLTLKHQLHPDHALHLVNASGDLYRYSCTCCLSRCNTFVYKCSSETTCYFYLDVNCAFLPNTIKHEFHNHPLTQVIYSKQDCMACDRYIYAISYACKDNCQDYHLCLYCALRSPRSLSHRFCKGHEISLTYPPVENHPEDFYCEICEEEMHPKLPLYYCHKKCKNSFHLGCLSPYDLSANVWIEGTKTWSYHEHPLTWVRRNKSNPKYVCSTCNCDINGRLILECRAPVCNFNICFPCHIEKKRYDE